MDLLSDEVFEHHLVVVLAVVLVRVVDDGRDHFVNSVQLWPLLAALLGRPRAGRRGRGRAGLLLGVAVGLDEQFAQRGKVAFLLVRVRVGV